jgi:outer membrane protein
VLGTIDHTPQSIPIQKRPVDPVRRARRNLAARARDPVTEQRNESSCGPTPVLNNSIPGQVEPPQAGNHLSSSYQWKASVRPRIRLNAISWFPSLAASSFCVLLGTTVGVAAQDLGLTGTPVPEPSKSSSGQGIVIDLGAGAAVAPAYEGSKTLRGSPLPLIDINGLADGRVSISTLHGVAVNIIDLGNLKAGVSINYSGGRGRVNSDRVQGLPNISGAATVSGFLTYDFRPFSVGLEVKDRIGPDSGIVISLGGDYKFRPLPKLQITVGPKVNFADRQYEQTFFGVSESSAVRATALGNPMRAYDATPGIKNVELSLTAKYTITERWSALAHVGLSELVGSAANSPLTQQKLQPTVAAGVAYRF